jgi:GNAT superfamily N-acetyltransferase
MMVKEDIDVVLPLAKVFYEESLKVYGFSFSEESLRQLAADHIATKSALVMERDGVVVGVIAGKFIKLALCDYTIFQETLWYVLPEYRGQGLRLFRECEKYCQSLGIKSIVMGNMANLNEEKMRKFYYSQGYKLMETQYVKTLIHS